MPIPESQLGRWSHHGAQDAAKRTHESIRTVLAAHTWPPGMHYEPYLQGSYPNHTNIRGDSDVDLVVEMSSTFHHDLTLLDPYTRQQVLASFSPARYEWKNFRAEVMKALIKGFGSAMVEQGNKAIKVKRNPPRLAADVVPCTEFRRYTSIGDYAEGMTFWARNGVQIINYPKQHIANGQSKNQRIFERYKPTVRMFKNARNVLESHYGMSGNMAPSYFLECFLYNAPDQCFQNGLQDTYCAIVNWLRSRSDYSKFVCQNEQRYLFGTGSTQWSEDNARQLVDGLIQIWNDWR